MLVRYFLNIILLLIITTFSFGQPVERLYKESTEQFVTRFKPENSKLSLSVLDTKWDMKPVIISFYEQTYKLPVQDDPDQQDYSRVIGEIFFQTDSNHYNRFIVDTIESEGGDPKIESVFFANADKDKNKEVIIIVSWPQVHAGVRGTLYGTYVYDDLLKNSEKKLRYIKNISQKLSGGCECKYEDGKSGKAKFKKAPDIKAELKRLGYK